MDNMIVAKTDPDVWNTMRKGPKIVDIEIQKTQLILLKAAVPVLSFINDIGTN